MCSERVGSGTYCSIIFTEFKGEKAVEKFYKDTTDFTSMMVECSILQLCEKSPHFVRMLGVRKKTSDQVPSIIMEYHEKGHLKPVLLNLELRKKYILQILSGLNFLHTNGIIHRDVKPENILVASNGDLKLCDFNISVFNGIQILNDRMKYSLQAGTLWWRAPEVLLDPCFYSYSVDVWSAGVVYLQLLVPNFMSRFLSGDSKIDQLFKSYKLIGTPGNPFVWPEAVRCQHWKASHPQWSPGMLDSILRDVSPEEKDFLMCMVTWPNKRKSTDYLLRHPFLSDQV